MALWGLRKRPTVEEDREVDEAQEVVLRALPLLGVLK